MASTISSSAQTSLNRSTLTRTLHSRYEQQARLQVQLATGEKISRASDDPTGHGIVLRLDTVVRQYDQLTRSIDAAVNWANSTQDTLDGISNLLSSAYEEGIRGANDTLDGDERERISERVDEILGELLDRLNTRTTGGYLFAGTNTTEKPFVLDNGPDADGAGVSYYGNDAVRERTVGVDLRMSVGIAGARMTADDGVALTEAVGALRDALSANDTAAIETALGQVTTARDHAINLTAESGVAAERLSELRQQIATANIRAQEQQSGLRDADLAETVTKIQKNQMGLQAALQAVSALYQTSILNYLR